MRFAIIPLIFVFVSACGVRGKPQPPLTPAEIGRGQPTFKGTTEQFAFPDVPSPESGTDGVPATSPTPRPRPNQQRPQRPTGRGSN